MISNDISEPDKKQCVLRANFPISPNGLETNPIDSAWEKGTETRGGEMPPQKLA